jgi:DNA end-binding protein Ku
MRSMWKGAISFGLVSIPISLFPATEKKDVKFRFLHSECRTPIKYERVCPACNREVPSGEIVRGYEYEKNRFVIIEDSDLENIPDERSRTIDILDFVDLAEIDPVYYDKTYFLGPGETGEKAYTLLRNVMEETGKVAIARVVIRTKESLAAVRVYKKEMLVMETMFFPDEIRDHGAIPVPARAVKIHENELKMARELVLNLADKFDPKKYHDQYRELLLDIIRAKVEGQEIEIPAHAERGNVVDLLDALKASVDLAKKTQDAEKKRAGAGGGKGQRGAKKKKAAGG